MKSFRWKKIGLVYENDMAGWSHSSHPCIINTEDDNFIVAFTCRDNMSKSHIFLSKAIIKDSTLLLFDSPKLCLSPGPLGFFDCDGAISVCFVKHNDFLYLYYVGWQNLPQRMWICDTGRVIVDHVSLKMDREFYGPIIGRDKNNPLFAAATAFLIIDGIWHTWYNSGLKWEESSNGLKHYYGIHHAISPNGIDWNFDNEMCIPFADEYEYAFGRPSIIKINNTYCMWFAHRATKYIDKYRMGFAYSYNLKSWNRDDKLSGIDVSNDGWDSEMICYPYVFEHKGRYFMLYNGNGYGKSGFGLAVLEED
ncbi:hypothetical protein SAMN06295888_11885 [Desulfonatronum zhilinae]|nr:hypothetical protein SAMN06295888_11885 [Desulfonatronum zhilinae]